MGYMFNKQFRGYNTEEVDETIASLEKNIQDRSLQIRRLEEELEKIKKENIAMANRQSTDLQAIHHMIPSCSHVHQRLQELVIYISDRC